jgi:ABC-type Na+ efflux pump permease subunit
MHLSTFSRVKKIILQTTLVLTVVFLAFVLILTLNALVPQTYTYSINTSGYQYADVIALNNKTITQSWCLNLHPQDIYGSGNIELKALCSKYYNQYFADIGISFAISLSVLIITLLLVLLVKSLSRFQRYKSYNQLCSSTIFNLLITNIFTTIIITMLLQA